MINVKAWSDHRIVLIQLILLTQSNGHESSRNPKRQRVTSLHMVNSTFLNWGEITKLKFVMALAMLI